MGKPDGKPRRFFYGWVEVSDEPGSQAGALGLAFRRAPSTPRDWTLRGALATPTLWLLFATRVMTPLGMMMVVPHHVAYLVGEGFDKLTAAFAFGSLGAFSFTGRVVFGSLSDRIGRVPTICLTYGLSIAGTLLLMALHDPSQTILLWCHIAIYGLGFGARGPVRALQCLLLRYLAAQPDATVVNAFYGAG